VKRLRFKCLKSHFFIAIIFFILLLGSSNALASGTYIYGVPTQSDFGDDALGDLRTLLFDIEKANMTVDMVGQTADSLSRLPDTYEKMKGKGKKLLNKAGVMSDDYVIENANPDDVARLEKQLDAAGITDPDKRKEHMARQILQYESQYGDIGLTGAEERQVMEQLAKSYSTREMAFDYGYADEKLRQMQEGELEEKIYAASDISQKIGEDFENQLMTDMSGYGKDTAGLVNDVKNFEDANIYEKIEIADRTLDRLNNFGEGNDSNLIKDQILSKIDNEKVNDMVNGLNKYGQFNPMTGQIDFSDNVQFGNNNGVGSYIPGYGENPQNYTQSEYMKQLEDAGYSPEDMVYIAEQLVPPEYHGAITLAKTALGMRLVIPGKVEIKADANPQYPLIGVQGEYTIGTRTSSKIIEPCSGFCTPDIRDAGIQQVTAEIKHNKYPTKKSALRGLPTKNNSIDGLQYRSNPFKQSGTYTLVVQSVDEAFVSTEMTYKIEVRAKDTSLTGDDNPIRDNDEEKNMETGKEYNPGGESNDLNENDKDRGFSFPGFNRNDDARYVRDNRNHDKYSNGASNNFWTTDNPMFNFGSSSNNNNDGENNSNDNQNNSQLNNTGNTSQNNQQDGSKKDIVDKAYSKLFGTTEKSENTKQTNNQKRNMYDRFFGEKETVSNKNTVNYNGSNNNEKILKLTPQKTQENIYERDKKLTDFIKYNEQEIYNRGFNKLNEQDKMVYPAIAQKHGLVEDTREFYTNNEVIELPNVVEQKIYEEIGDTFVKNQLSIKVNGDYQSIISSTYIALNEETEKALGNIQMVFKPNESAYGYNPNKLEIGLAFKGKNDNRQIQYLKIEKKSNGYQVYSMNPNRSNKINKYWEKIDGFMLNEAEYKEIQKGLAESKFE